MHWSAQEFGEAQLVSRQPRTTTEGPDTSSRDRRSEDEVTSGLPLEFIGDIPPLQQIDMSRIPPEYKVVTSNAPWSLKFDRGATYSVSVVGDHYVDISVTAT